MGGETVVEPECTCYTFKSCQRHINKSEFVEIQTILVDFIS